LDKFEYRIKTEQMLEYMEAKSYKKAMEIADSIDWRKVRNPSLLCSVSEIYECNGEFQKSRDILFIAYDKSPRSRKIVYRLGTLALKLGDIDEATDCYEEFVRMAPKDPNQFILRYKVLRAQNAPFEQQIETLKEFKKAEYVEKWAYELAKIYNEAGMTAECLEECDDLILWFSEGKYVYRAMELKKRYKPLTTLQKEKYDQYRANIHKGSVLSSDKDEAVVQAETDKPEREEEPADALSEADEEEKAKDDPVEDVSVEGDTAEDNPAEGDSAEEDPIEAAAAAEPAVAQAENNSKKVSDTVIGDEMSRDGRRYNSTEGDSPFATGQMKIEEILRAWEEKQRENAAKIQELRQQREEELAKAEEIKQDQAAEAVPSKGATAPLSDEIRELMENLENGTIDSYEEPEYDEEEPEEEPEDDDHENMGAIVESLQIDEDEEEEYEEELDEEVYEEDLDDDGYEEDFDEEVYEEDLDDDGYEEDFDEEVYEEEVYEEDLDDDGYEEDFDEEAYEEDLDDDGYEEDFDEEVYEEDFDDDDEYEEDFDDEELDDEEYEEDFEDEEYDEEYDDDEFEDEEGRDAEYDEGLDDDQYDEDFDDELEEAFDDSESDEEDYYDEEDYIESDEDEDAESDDDQDDADEPLDLEKALEIEEPSEEEIKERLNKSKGGVSFDTGFIVQGRYDLSATSEIGLKVGLTEEQKRLFSYFVPIRGVSEQIVTVLENDKRGKRRNGTSRTGNILVVGRKGTGKTVLAVDLVKAIQKERQIKQGKVAIITGEAMNKKELTTIMKKLHGGALIIEKAGKLNTRTIKELNDLMEAQTGEMLVILEEQRKPLDKMFAANPRFKKKFTSKVELPIFINDELVTFGQTYAKENGYKIDDMGILALYSRIDVMQREDHAVTVAEVKEIMDEAIDHSQKSNVKHLMKRVFGKSTDEGDRIILKEDDFKR